MAEHFPLEDLGQCCTVLEQILSHHDHNSYRPLPWWVNQPGSGLWMGRFRHGISLGVSTCSLALLRFVKQRVAKRQQWGHGWEAATEPSSCESTIYSEAGGAELKWWYLWWCFQMLCARWESIRAKTWAETPSWCQTCTITCTWSCSELRGTSTSQDLLYSSGCEFSVSWVHSCLTKTHILCGCSPFHLQFTVEFFCSVMKRVVTLINQLASVSSTTAALQVQADNANQAAKKYMEDNELLKQVGSYSSMNKTAILMVSTWWRNIVVAPQTILGLSKYSH